MSYSKQELIDALIEFKNEYGRYPTRKDFRAKRITPSKNVFYRNFGSMENAIKQAELYESGKPVLEDEQERKSLKPSSKKGGFQCPFCGNWKQNAEEYYSSLTILIINRFIDLLNSNNGEGYFSAVMDCIYKVFGTKNQTVRRALEKEGYLEEFEQRHNVEEQDLSSQSYGKLKCYKCGKYKDDGEITIDIVSPYRTENICEDCLSKKQQRGKKEDPKN